MTKYLPETVIIKPTLKNKFKNKNSRHKSNNKNIKILMKISAKNLSN